MVFYINGKRACYAGQVAGFETLGREIEGLCYRVTTTLSTRWIWLGPGDSRIWVVCPD